MYDTIYMYMRGFRGRGPEPPPPPPRDLSEVGSCEDV